MKRFDEAYETAQKVADRLIHSELNEEDTKNSIAALIHAVAVMTQSMLEEECFAKRHPILSKMGVHSTYDVPVMASIISTYSVIAQSELDKYTAKYGAFLDIK